MWDYKDIEYTSCVRNIVLQSQKTGSIWIRDKIFCSLIQLQNKKINLNELLTFCMRIDIGVNLLLIQLF